MGNILTAASGAITTTFDATDKTARMAGRVVDSAYHATGVMLAHAQAWEKTAIVTLAMDENERFVRKAVEAADARTAFYDRIEEKYSSAEKRQRFNKHLDDINKAQDSALKRLGHSTIDRSNAHILASTEQEQEQEPESK
jgi:hypothetical protein